MAGSRGHLQITPVVAQTSEAVAGLASSLMCECSAVRLTPRLDGDRMSTEVMSVDDLVDLFPQYPRSAVEDVLQRVGPAQAVETLLTFSDDVLVSRLPAISIFKFEPVVKSDHMLIRSRPKADRPIAGPVGYECAMQCPSLPLLHR